MVGAVGGGGPPRPHALFGLDAEGVDPRPACGGRRGCRGSGPPLPLAPLFPPALTLEARLLKDVREGPEGERRHIGDAEEGRGGVDDEGAGEGGVVCGRQQRRRRVSEGRVRRELRCSRRTHTAIRGPR